MGHTPGPWGCDGTEVHAEHLVICTAYRSRTDDEGNWMSNEEVEANARLIAAAPELLRALRNLLPWGGDPKHRPPQGWGMWAEAIEAIAKAEGRSASREP